MASDTPDPAAMARELIELDAKAKQQNIDMRGCPPIAAQFLLRFLICSPDVARWALEQHEAAKEAERLREELALWKPLTPEEAEAALNEAEAVPLSEDRINEIVEFATDPGNKCDNNEQAQLAAAVKWLRERVRELEQEQAAQQRFVSSLRKAHGYPDSESPT